MKHLITQSPRVEVVQDAFEAYASFPGVNNSALSLFDEARGGCPVKARHYMQMTHDSDELEPDDEEGSVEEVTEALAFGTLYHSYLLDRPNFEHQTVVLDDHQKELIYQMALAEKYGALKKPSKTFEAWLANPPGNTPKGFSKQLGAYKKWRAAVEEDQKTVVDGLKLGQLQAMERAMLNESVIAEALDVPKLTEVSIYFGLPVDVRDESAGFVQCKARIDSLPKDGQYVDDLKTVRSAATEEFARSMIKYGYDRQAAWYMRACQAVGLEGKSRFRFLVQEKTAPYVAALYELPGTWLNFANKEVMKTFYELKAALVNDEWRGYVSGQILPPEWLEEIIDQESPTPFMGGKVA